MEIQAYQASIVFRDWEDSTKGTIYYEHLQKGDKKMSTKNWKNKELTTLLSEAWGFKFNTLQEFEEFDGSGEIQEEGAEEIEELAARGGGKASRTKPQGTGARVEPTAPFEDPPTGKDEKDEKGGDVVEEETSDVKSDTITKEHIEALVKKTIKEVLLKRKG